MRIAPRLIAPLIACVVALGAAVVGGACTFPTTSNPPTLVSGSYVLSFVNGQPPPATFTDSTRSLRVFTDTFNLDATTHLFDEHASVAITPRGGVQQPVSLIVISHQSYVMTTPSTPTFFITIYGTSTPGSTLSATSFQLQLPDHTVWRYDKR